MTIYICYEWEFDGYDDIDTTMGENQDTFTFGGTLYVTAVQAG